jgi:hypothetical protein
MTSQHCDKLRYCVETAKWHLWSGSRWEPETGTSTREGNGQSHVYGRVSEAGIPATFPEVQGLLLSEVDRQSRPGLPGCRPAAGSGWDLKDAPQLPISGYGSPAWTTRISWSVNTAGLPSRCTFGMWQLTQFLSATRQTFWVITAVTAPSASLAP